MSDWPTGRPPLVFWNQQEYYPRVLVRFGYILEDQNRAEISVFCSVFRSRSNPKRRFNLEAKII